MYAAISYCHVKSLLKTDNPVNKRNTTSGYIGLLRREKNRTSCTEYVSIRKDSLKFTKYKQLYYISRNDIFIITRAVGGLQIKCDLFRVRSQENIRINFV